MARAKAEEELAYAAGGGGGELDAMLVMNLVRTHSCLAPFLDAAVRGQKLTAAQFNALLVLRSAGEGGLRMGQIGQRLVVTKSNVTGLVDRLERGGLVERGRQGDRRATVVRLTRAGAGVLERALPRHARLLAELTGCLSDRQKATLIRLLTKLRRELRSRRKGGGR